MSTIITIAQAFRFLMSTPPKTARHCRTKPAIGLIHGAAGIFVPSTRNAGCIVPQRKQRLIPGKGHQTGIVGLESPILLCVLCGEIFLGFFSRLTDFHAPR
jgi:hypothetical protein